ncbi:putative inner membrane protein [compost metagenome]
MARRPVDRPLQVFTQLVFYSVLVLLAGILIRPFWEALAWALVIAFVTWPTFRRLLRALKGQQTLAAFLMLLVVVTVVAVPLTLILRAAAVEGALMLESIRAWLASNPFPAILERYPQLALIWENALEPLIHDSKRLGETLGSQALPWLKAIAGAGTNLFQLGLAFFTLFFFYRNGENYARKTRAVLRRFLGDDIDRILYPVRETTRAVFFGVILAALSQGAVAGLGYTLFGIPSPVLLGILTGICALLPFGATVIWVPAGAWLLLQGELWQGIGLLLWGVLAISTIDNLVRPLFISGTTRLPYLQVFFAFLGGLAAFGLLGLFLGPAILSIWMVLWEEWARPIDEGLAEAEPSRS